MRLWIARDKNKFPGVTDLWGFIEKPTLNANERNWILPDMEINIKERIFEFDSDLFPEVQFKNSPQEIEIRLINKDSNEKG